MIRPGTYKARAREWALGMSQSGKEQIAVLLEVADGPHAHETITWYGYFTDATVERTLDSLRFLGWQSDSLAELDGLDAKEVEIVVDEEVYDGRTRTKVRWINRAGLPLREQMTAGQVQSFAQRLMGRVIAHKQKAGGGRGGLPAQAAGARGGYPTTPPAVPGNVEPDDLPF